jgi:hypothetical protein
MKVRVIRVPDCDTRIIRTKFGFCKLLPEIPEQNSGILGSGSGIPGSGFGLRIFCPALSSGREFFEQNVCCIVLQFFFMKMVDLMYKI